MQGVIIILHDQVLLGWFFFSRIICLFIFVLFFFSFFFLCYQAKRCRLLDFLPFFFSPMFCPIIAFVRTQKFFKLTYISV
jgi:hypothetical protein